jgi:competence protein ComEA
MRPLLRGDRDESVDAGPRSHSESDSRTPSFAARLARAGAWARESLAARALAVAAGLGILALIGSSALARGPGAASPTTAATASASAAATSPASAAPPADAGAPAAPSEEAASSNGARSPPGSPVRRATPDDPVDLNTATPDDLRRLPGVGAKRALAIVTMRSRLPGGRIKQIEDLLKVKGIGRAMLKRLKPLVRIG